MFNAQWLTFATCNICAQRDAQTSEWLQMGMTDVKIPFAKLRADLETYEITHCCQRGKVYPRPVKQNVYGDPVRSTE